MFSCNVLFLIWVYGSSTTCSHAALLPCSCKTIKFLIYTYGPSTCNFVACSCLALSACHNTGTLVQSTTSVFLTLVQISYNQHQTGMWNKFFSFTKISALQTISAIMLVKYYCYCFRWLDYFCVRVHIMLTSTYIVDDVVNNLLNLMDWPLRTCTCSDYC